MPRATQNELDGEDAKKLLANGREEIGPKFNGGLPP